MLEKTYRPDAVEQKHYAQWEKAGAFTAGKRANAAPYTIVIPPPNVTGSLHMGHALNNTLQDILIRFERMRGRDALWQPGTDHAGIATQMVVERQLEAKGESRHDLGREEFIKRIWEWKAESGGIITNQLKRLGASCDWDRERFTMDEGLSAAVRKVFVELHRQGLIYKDKRLVNWDPHFHTAISDLEVEQRDVKGHLWHIRYLVALSEDGESEEGVSITVATTRPETMLGDTAIAVHPDDERYQKLIGKFAILPLVGRKIPIVADNYADPEQGSGAVKITPAHDFNDFEVGRRHDLEVINIFDADAALNDNVPEAYRGLDRLVAREKVLEDLEAQNLVVEIDDIEHTVPYGDRSGEIIEPWLTDQWYVDAKTLAKPAIEAVENGKVEFVPKNWENTYFEWMRNIQPWCISRQLWWGHQIPAWYGPDGHIFVELTEAEALAAAKTHYGKDTKITRDEDVLDTWFSSALWPFSTLGWPEMTPEVERYYPTDVLVTGFDIIFFWVARMMMMGIHFMGEVPFHKVYIHALVRDEKGAKMSKSKGNVMDPLELVDEYGADALRFTLAAMAAQGRDIKLAKSRVEGYRNFATKLWNSTRFCQMNECVPVPGYDPEYCTLPVNRWIAGEVSKTAKRITTALEDYKFNEAADALYHFAWGTFCDWYLELIKPVLLDGHGAELVETRATAPWALSQIVHMLHPFMPFISEELAEVLGTDEGDDDSRGLILAAWPDIEFSDANAAAEIEWVIRVVSEIRAVRAALNVPAGAKIACHVLGAKPETIGRISSQEDVICRLARLEFLMLDVAAPEGSVQALVDDVTYALPLAGVIDVATERKRLKGEIERANSEIAKIDKKLGNEQFLAKAPDHVIDEQHTRRDDAEQIVAKLSDALKRIDALG